MISPNDLVVSDDAFVAVMVRLGLTVISDLNTMGERLPAHNLMLRKDRERTMDQNVRDLAEHLLQAGFDDLPERERRVISRIAKRVHISQNLNRIFEEKLTIGQRLSDRLSAFGGSWTFIILFGIVLSAWVLLNSVILFPLQDAFDPYPYIFLNLILSMLAAIQAPVIMMSQNRQAAKDRLAASHDYEVNLKAELEIMRLHEKMDELRQRQLNNLLEKQEEQILLVRQIVESGRPASDRTD